jgi:hypothetical protein
LREKLNTERAARIAEYEKQLAAYGNTMNSVIGPPTEAMRIVGKLALEHIQAGAESLEAAVSQIKKRFPDIEDRDVWEALRARSPETAARTRSAAEVNLSEFKKQAGLLTKMDRLREGMTDKPTARGSEAVRTKELRQQARQLRKSLYESEMPAERLEKAIEILAELDAMYKGRYRALRDPKRVDLPDLADIKQKQDVLRRAMGIEDRIADIQEQLRTGDFKVPVRKTPFFTPELQRAQVEKTLLMRQWRAAVAEAKPKTFGDRVGQVSAAIKTQITPVDVSATMRQGLILTSRRAFSDPGGLLRRNVDSWNAMISKMSDEKIYNNIKNDPMFADAISDGLAITEKGQRGDFYQSTLPERVPLWGRVVQAGERHMRTYMNVMRWDSYKKWREMNPNATGPERNAMARSLNIVSGKGDLNLGIVGKGLFASQFTASRLQTPFLIVEYWKYPRVRKELAKQFASTAALGVSALAMIKMAGGEVGTDPKEMSSFGKARIRDMRFDLWGGYRQPIALILRMGTGTRWAELKDEVDPYELFGEFAKYKLDPLITLPIEAVTGLNVIGQKVTPLETAAHLVVPLMAQDMKEAFEREGIRGALAAGVAAGVGYGVQSYPDSEKTTRKNVREFYDRARFGGGTSADSTALETQAKGLISGFNKRDPANQIKEVKDARALKVAEINAMEKIDKTKAEKIRSDWNKRHPLNIIM